MMLCAGFLAALHTAMCLDYDYWKKIVPIEALMINKVSVELDS